MPSPRIGHSRSDRAARRVTVLRLLAVLTAVMLFAPAPAYAQDVDPTAEWEPAPAVPTEDFEPAEQPSPEHQAFSSTANIDTFDRTSVLAAYNNIYVPAASVPSDWTGAVAGCKAGRVSDAYRDASLAVTNWSRSMVGQAPMQMDGSFVPEVQQTSLLMQANNSLSHDPPPSWDCWTDAGHLGASRSNLSFRPTVEASVVAGLISDAGSNNGTVGHRWWILRPGQHWVEFGATNQMATMWVVDERSPFVPTAGPDTYWPPAGYVPEEFVTGRWSVFSWDEPLFVGDTPSIQVSMTLDGAPIDSFVEYSDSGRVVVKLDDTLLFELRNGPQDRVVDISISIPQQSGADRIHRWQTTFIDPMFLPALPDPGPVSETCDGKNVTVNMNTGQEPTDGDDVILGTPAADWIQAGAGNDVICAGDGADMVDAGPGDDIVFGGPGDDEILGGNGDDIIRSGSGEDVVSGGDGADRIFGGIGADEINGGEGNDYLGGFGGNDTIYGGLGDDTIMGGFGADIIDAGPGDDTVRGLIGDDTIYGGTGNDVLDGDRGNDRIQGDGGHDIVRGGNAADTIWGNDGNDDLSGGKADDQLFGGSGTDVCTGNKEVNGDSADATCERVFGVNTG